MSDTFTVEVVADTPRYLLLRLRGILDGHNASKLMDACAGHVAGQRLILNLANVEMVTSSGIGALLALVEEHGQEFGQVRVAAPSSSVSAVIRVLNLDQFLTLDATEQQSIQAAEAA
jgi:anti-anti-sigma factor